MMSTSSFGSIRALWCFGAGNPTEFIDDSGREVKGLEVLRAMPTKMEYNQVLGFNNTIITVDLQKEALS